jgi:hypothetical protein
MIYAESISPAANPAVVAVPELCLAGATELQRPGSPGGPPSRRLGVEHRFGPVKPSPTQSCLVVPSRTFNSWRVDPIIPEIRGIRVYLESDSRQVRGFPHPPSPRLRRTGPTWSNPVKPSPTLNLSFSQRAETGQKKPMKAGQESRREIGFQRRTLPHRDDVRIRLRHVIDCGPSASHS